MENNIKIHNLKLSQPYFNMVWTTKKKSEIRLNDRNYKIGDTVILQEYKTQEDKYTGYKIEVNITNVLLYIEGLEKGYCMFCFEIIKRISPEFPEFPEPIKSVDILGEAITEPNEIDK